MFETTNWTKENLNKTENISTERAIRKVLLLQGGISSEREISLKSGKCVQKALLELGYEVVPFDTSLGIEKLLQIIKEEKPDCAFNALHGGYGENGCIQAFLNMMRLPYTHSGVLASALAMNKNKTKQIATNLDIDTPVGCLVDPLFFTRAQDVIFNCVIKPNTEGSSIGVHIVKAGSKIPAALKENKENIQSFLIEEYINGREFSVACTDTEALGIIELVPNDGFYDYEHKYSDGMTKHIEPMDLPVEVRKKLLSNAYMMHKGLGCKGVSRSDFRYDADADRVVFLELNANPGMTDLSLVPEMALQKKITYNELVDMLIKKADFEK